MKIRCKAPLRLGLAGGGTDVSPYSDLYGGCVLNATINLYAHVYIDTDIESHEVIFNSLDLGVIESISSLDFNIDEKKLILHSAVYKYMMDKYNGGNLIPLRLFTYTDAPPGSGLGSSSTLVVALVESFRQLLNLALGEYEIAQIAYLIERTICGLSGGKQDQYAATFGGFNFIEFFENDRVVVNPLRIRNYIKNELEASLILYYLGASRSSAKIIDDQIKSVSSDEKKLSAMHDVKRLSYDIKEHIFRGDIARVSNVFRDSWVAKKQTSKSITNPLIDDVEKVLLDSGALALKVSGAGGGGFMMIFINPEDRLKIQDSLKKFDGKIYNFNFTNDGVYSWTV